MRSGSAEMRIIMKKKTILTASLFIAALFCFLFLPKTLSAAEPNPGDEIIENDESGIPDPYLYQCVLEILHKNEDETFTKAEAATIDWIEIKTSKYPVKNFKGIGYFTNLQQLDLHSYGLKSLANMEELPSLWALSVESNKIKNIDALALENFKNLTYLSVSDNQLSTLNGIEVLSNLKWLYADYNKITDIKVLKKLNHLEYVDASGNQLTSLKPLRNCTKVKKLDVSYNKLKTLSDLKKLKNLQELSFRFNEIKNVDVLLNFKNLTQLDGKYNQLKKLPDLKKLKKLYSIDLRCNLLSEQEIRNKAPKKFLKNRAWLSDVITFQHMIPELDSPADFHQITRKTTKITGRLPIGKAYNKKIYIDFSPWGRRNVNRTAVNSDGTFVMDHLNLKKYKKGQEMVFCVYIYSAEMKGYTFLDTVRIFLK